jgi:hypothetical protein
MVSGSGGSAMGPVQLLRLLLRAPFRPFRIFLSSGIVHEVRHPELVIVGLTTVTLELPGAAQLIPLANREIILAFGHIVQLEITEPINPTLN